MQHNKDGLAPASKIPIATQLSPFALDVCEVRLLCYKFAMLCAAFDEQSKSDPSNAREIKKVLQQITAYWSKLRNSNQYDLEGRDPNSATTMESAFSRTTEGVFSCFENAARRVCSDVMAGGVPASSELKELVRFVSTELAEVLLEVSNSAQMAAEADGQRVAAQAMTDPLTGLPNRRALHDYFHKNEQFGWQHNGVSILRIDLDKFKKVNDLMGHAAGDAALQHATTVLNSFLSSEDFLARVGGDEFVIVFFGDLQEGRLSEIAEDMIGAMSVPFVHEGRECIIGASVGIASGQKSDDVALIKCLNDADLALYATKDGGRSSHRFFSPNLRTKYEEVEELQAFIREGLGSGQFEPFFQPQVEGRSGKIIGFESLARWHHPTRGVLTPFHFLEAAEADNVLDQLDRQLMDKTFSAVSYWESLGYNVPQISVNLTASRLSEVDLVDTLISAAENAALAPAVIGVEILESAMIENDSRRMIENIKNLAEAGFKVELDDFGTGHASISNLRHFQVDRIKIDRSFVKDIHLFTDLARITSAMIALAHSLRVDALAEGVETPEERMVLNALGCDHIQGFGVAKPMPASEVPAWINASQRSRKLPPRRQGVT